MLEDKNVIITGAGSGIGRAACLLFAAEGAHVVGVDVDADPLSEVVTQIGGDAVVGNVADPDVWETALAAVAGRPGGLDVVYLNAGVYGFHGPIEELPLDVFQHTINANIAGVVLGTRATLPALRANGGGAIVATASVAGVVAFEGNPIYTLTKQAVTGFVRAVAPSLVADRVSIDAVCPGIVDTAMTVEALGGADPSESGIPLIDPARIAEVALSLATTEGTGRCRVVRQLGDTVDWSFPTWTDLFSAQTDER
jgi:NAD(P)-dependent dehydrogenase (short-subunit alcohol dehydrogenase family)